MSLIIEQARQALVGYFVLVCTYICMFVCNGITIKIYGFTHSLCTILAYATYEAMAMEVEVENLEERREHQARE